MPKYSDISKTSGLSGRNVGSGNAVAKDHLIDTAVPMTLRAEPKSEKLRYRFERRKARVASIVGAYTLSFITWQLHAMPAAPASPVFFRVSDAQLKS